MNHTDAELIETPKPPPRPEAWIIHARYTNGDFECYPFSTKERATAWSSEGLIECRHRLFRIPSEREAARSALVAELHRAAVELASEVVREGWDSRRMLDRKEAFIAAQSALAAFDARKQAKGEQH